MAVTLRQPNPIVPPDADPAKMSVLEQVTVSTELLQEKLPMIPEIDSLVVDSTVPVRHGGGTSHTGKQKLASQEEEPGCSRDLQMINPEFIKGRNSEYPRG